MNNFSFILCTLLFISFSACKKDEVLDPQVTSDNAVVIPDDNFKSYLISNSEINTNGDDEIQFEEAAAFTGQIDVNYMEISDLTGIEMFTALTELDCMFNSISNLDLLNNTKLTELSCASNNLTSLNISQNLELISLNCGANSITSLDVSKHTSLVHLNFQSNLLDEIDVSNNTLLTLLSCSIVR
ncbi:MAG: hypothetical protein HRT71_11005 [Flavobacteriales bacterium]|nr:hypothetical protein [Flavobacteriales bacterium]